MPIFKYRSIAAYCLEEIIVPLKPIYGKAPLTSLNSLALRPGQVRMEGEKMAKLYALLNASGKDCAAAWEPAFRMACLLCKKPMEEPSAKWILACAESQQVSGALPGSVMETPCLPLPDTAISLRRLRASTRTSSSPPMKRAIALRCASSCTAISRWMRSVATSSGICPGMAAAFVPPRGE